MDFLTCTSEGVGEPSFRFDFLQTLEFWWVLTFKRFRENVEPLPPADRPRL